MFGGIEVGGGPSLEQYKCLFESADDETLAKLWTMGPGTKVGVPLPPELLDIITRCGPIPGVGETELTPEERCIIEAIGETAFSEFLTGQRRPTQEEMQKMEACQVPAGPGEEDGPPELTPEQQSCVIEAIGETAFSELLTGQRPPTMEEIQKIEPCDLP